MAAGVNSMREQSLTPGIYGSSRQFFRQFANRPIYGIFYTLKAQEKLKKRPIINVIGDYRAFDCSNRIGLKQLSVR
jgi:hypothetical protein